MVDPISVIATPIVKLIGEKLAPLVHEKYLQLAGFSEDVKRLEAKIVDIHKFLEIAENVSKNSDVTHLIQDLKEATHDAENVLDTVATEALLWNEKQQEVNLCPSSASKWGFRWKHRSKVNKIKKSIETFNSIHKRFEDMNMTLKDVKEGSSRKKENKENHNAGPVLQSEVVGRKEEKRKILEMLNSDRYNVEGRIFWTPITGMGGIGKTTLAQQVFNDTEGTKDFIKKIWIPVSNRDWGTNLVRILEAIKTACAKDLMQTTLEEVVEHCVQDLKLLIVLDDVWSEDLKDWKNLEKVLLKADKGTRVIVTSRSLNVFGLSLENVSNTELQELPHEDCWSIFAKNAIDGDVSTLKSKGVMEIADKIVQKCGGLPLAVEVIGCLLRTKDFKEWSDILKYDLAKFEEDEYIDKEHHRTLPVLKVSYVHLSPRLKQCFSFCSLFPKGHQFDKDELVKLWIAHSLIGPSKSAESIEHRGRKCFDRLQVLSFFQKQPDSEKYRMHDYMHELAELVSGKYSHMLKNDENNALDPQTHHISLICEKVEEKCNAINNCMRLRTFLLPQSRQHLTNFGDTLSIMFQKLRYLRVLDLSSSRLAELPETVGKLKLLSYLNLSRTEIKRLPDVICCLLNLQTLKLLDCPWFSTLPKDLSRLIKLRHLEIDDAFWKYRCSMQPPNIGRLTCLHNLHKFRIGKSSNGSGIEELKDMKHLEGSLHIMELNNAVHAAEAKLKDKQRLQVLELEWAIERDVTRSEESNSGLEDYDAQVLEDLEPPHSSLIELRVYNYCGNMIPSWLRGGQLQFLKQLLLQGCKNLEALTIGSQPNLGVLCIKNMQKLRELPVELDCPSLHTLKISNCPQLIQLPHSIPNLQLMKIKKCTALKIIPPLVDVTRTLELVDNLVLEGFHDFSLKGFYDLGAFLFRCKIMGCPNFAGFPAKYNSSRASINSKLEIGHCESIEIHRRRSLTELMIDTCHKDAFLKALKIISQFKLRIRNDSDVSIHYSQSLTISNISSLISFPTNWEVKLVSLYIWACKDLEALFDSTVSCKRSFPCLVNLSVHDCPKLSKFPEEGLPPKLELLMVQSCPNLDSLGPPEVLKDLHSLADVYIEDCPKLQSFPAQGFPSSVKHLRIRGCPELAKRCNNEIAGATEWPKIMNVPYLEIEKVQAPSQLFTCFTGA
ncbi:hypothetical protein ACH5RR_023565 [Cinchona calisaya]|uniref:Disease resistance protein n=1 Tax=Cinchona calisaya TaxID=153742 RepID=A0ABD2ZG29_9GENT